MAPIKLEEHIKEQLEERRIAPSEAGWERLSGQLAMHQGKKKSTRVLWMSIAASFIIGVGLTTWYLQDNDTARNPIVVTPEKEESPSLEDESTTNNLPLLRNEKGMQQVAQVETNTTATNQEKKAQIVTKQKEKLKPQSTVPVVNQKPTFPVNKNQNAVIANRFENTKDASNSQKFDTVIATKVDEVIAVVEEQEIVTDQEIETLLQNAQRDIISKQLLNEINTAVNAQDLLLDAEYEVDPDTFKDKVFRTLKKEFSKVREAVANKDN